MFVRPRDACARCAALAPAGILSAAPADRRRAGAHHAAQVRSSQLDVLEAHGAVVTGALLEGHRDGRPGRVVALQGLGPRGWRTLPSARTGARGALPAELHAALALGSERVRLRFAGDAYGRPAQRVLGRLNVYRLAGASWYGGGGGSRAADRSRARRSASRTRRCRAARSSRCATAVTPCASRSSTAARTSKDANSTSPKRPSARSGSATPARCGAPR